MQIREELERRGLTQKEFAALVDTTAAHLCGVLCGARRVRAPTLDRWAAALGMCWQVTLIPEDGP